MHKTDAPALQELMARRKLSRRSVLRVAGALGLGAAVAPLLGGCGAMARLGQRASANSLTFKELHKSNRKHHLLPEGYRAETLIAWGDGLAGGDVFDPKVLTPNEQARRFGYNNDFTAYLPIAPGTENNDHGLLFVNHEYTNLRLMFGGLTRKTELARATEQQGRIEQEAQGFSIVEIRRGGQGWRVEPRSIYAGRVTGTTPIRISGPAAGHARMRTSEDTLGILCKGTFANCAGGVTPWGTILSCEENFHTAFVAPHKKSREAENARRYGIGEELEYAWHRYDSRFDGTQEPNEPNRFGWVVEYDPYHPEKPPVKRTALGRFKHESANCVLTPDQRVVVYSGDDEAFEYLYKFVSSRPVHPYRREANAGLLDDGVLYVARMREDGTGQWLPLVFGQGPLTKQNGFSSQADVLIETRRAADLMGATPMDRPEDVEVNPTSGRLYVVMTKNPEREAPGVANRRAPNPFGHILEFLPPKRSGVYDHGAEHFSWEVFLEGGDPADPAHAAFYPSPVSEQGWLTNPDNIAFDPRGRIWIATDGQPGAIGMADGLYAAETVGQHRGSTRLFFTGPTGCEICGPSFTPDGKTLFLSVQHPGDDRDSTYDHPSTRWPDFSAHMPPRPAVLAITKNDAGPIGS